MGKTGFIVLVTALAAIVAAMSAPRSASAAADCGATVISDWRDGQIDGAYAPRCYREALSELPEDIRIYSSAQDDINRALVASFAKKNEVGANQGAVRKLADRKPKVAAQRQAARAAALDPSASALPVPVLVAGGSAVALVAAAMISVVARRLRRASS